MSCQIIQAAAEEFAVAYENTYKMPIVVVHTMNVFGERQLPGKFIPKVLHSVMDETEVTIHADSSRTKPGSRRYIHAKVRILPGVLKLILRIIDQ